MLQAGTPTLEMPRRQQSPGSFMTLRRTSMVSLPAALSAHKTFFLGFHLSVPAVLQQETCRMLLFSSNM